MSINKPPHQPMVEQTFGEKLETWYDRNGLLINGVIIVALVAVIGYKGYQWMHQRGVARANAAFATALNHYQQGLHNPEEAKKQDELNGAVTAAQQVVNEYSDKFVGRQAQLLIGNAQYAIAMSKGGRDVETLKKALDSFKKYTSLAHDDFERATGHIAEGNVSENLAFVQDDQKVLEEAIASYKKAADLAGDSALGGEARLAAARAQTGIKNDPAATDDARKMLEHVAQNRPVQLVSEETLKAIKPVEMASGMILASEQVSDIRNMVEWSQQQHAKDALAQLK